MLSDYSGWWSNYSPSYIYTFNDGCGQGCGWGSVQGCGNGDGGGAVLGWGFGDGYSSGHGYGHSENPQKYKARRRL